MWLDLQAFLEGQRLYDMEMRPTENAHLRLVAQEVVKYFDIQLGLCLTSSALKLSQIGHSHRTLYCLKSTDLNGCYLQGHLQGWHTPGDYHMGYAQLPTNEGKIKMAGLEEELLESEALNIIRVFLATMSTI